MLNYIPKHVQEKAFKEYGETLEGAAEAIWQFNKEIVDKTYDLIPAVKPQIAMYEQFGIPGLMAYKKTVDYCKSKDLVVIGDIKRGDIGSTSAAYAVGHLGKVQVGENKIAAFDEDFATVNPYLGSDGVKPFIDVCKEEKKGIFVLVKTSNPSSGEFQDRLIDGRPLYELVGEKVAQWGEECMGDSYSYVGAVVGATYPEMGKVLRKIMPKAYILVPGYGAQGGQGKDLVHFFNEDGLGAIVNSSRGIIAAYKQEKYARFGEENFGDASRASRIISQEMISPDIYSMWLSAAEIAGQAAPGQFISLYCQDSGRILPRPISICEIDKEKGALRIVYRIAGAGTREFSKKQPGETIDILGPLGNGFPMEETKGKRVFLMGGGIGIPPMLETAKQCQGEVTAIAGYRDKNVFLQEEFENAIRENHLEADMIFACGPAPMLRAIKAYAQEQDIPCYISMEERMACGIGACLACVCKSKEVDAHSQVHNKRICKDGPVFLSTEVEL